MPRQRFGEYNFVSELKIWDRQADRQTDRHRYFLICSANKNLILDTQLLSSSLEREIGTNSHSDTGPTHFDAFSRALAINPNAQFP